MTATEELEHSKKQITDKANQFAEDAKPYIDQLVAYTKSNPVQSMVATGVLAFLLGGILFGSRR